MGPHSGAALGILWHTIAVLREGVEQMLEPAVSSILGQRVSVAETWPKGGVNGGVSLAERGGDIGMTRHGSAFCKLLPH